VSRLSPKNAERVALLFAGGEAGGASELIERECSQFDERVQTAVIKVSEGTMEGLLEAIALAQTDWRDLLVAAGFEHDPKLHETWWPSENTG
jgi:hypothetical protein